MEILLNGNRICGIGKNGFVQWEKMISTAKTKRSSCRRFMVFLISAPVGQNCIFKRQSTAKKICAEAKIDPEMKVRDLTTEQEALLRTEVDKFVVEGELRREVQMNIKNKMEIKSYQGIRHIKGLPVHGQSTRSNAKTRKGKGKVVANKKKVGK